MASLKKADEKRTVSFSSAFWHSVGHISLVPFIACLKGKGGYMVYIIENAQILNGSQMKQQSLIIHDKKIVSVAESARMYKYFRMDGSPFIMVPAYVYADLPFHSDSPGFLDPALQRDFLLEGCTAVLTAVKVSKANELRGRIKDMQNLLKNSLLDYIIGVVVHAKRLTPELLRKCQTEKVPVVFIRTDSEKDLLNIEWGWIKQAIFPYNSRLAVIPEGVHAQRILKIWKEMMKKEKIPSLANPVPEKKPIGNMVLKKVGIIPKISGLRQGGELSYNLYLKDTVTNNLNEQELYATRNSHLMYTVHKGKVVRAGGLFLGEAGNGERIEIRIPSFTHRMKNRKE